MYWSQSTRLGPSLYYVDVYNKLVSLTTLRFVTDGFEKVNNLSDKLLANIGETTKENFNELVSCVNDLLLYGAKECNMIKLKHYNKKHRNSTPKSNNWFDMECKDKRNAFNRARRRYRDNKSEDNLNQMRLAGKDYKVIYIIKERLETSSSMESYLPTSDRHAASWIFSDGPRQPVGVVKLRYNALKLFVDNVAI